MLQYECYDKLFLHKETCTIPAEKSRDDNTPILRYWNLVNGRKLVKKGEWSVGDSRAIVTPKTTQYQ